MMGPRGKVEKNRQDLSGNPEIEFVRCPASVLISPLPERPLDVRLEPREPVGEPGPPEPEAEVVARVAEQRPRCQEYPFGVEQVLGERVDGDVGRQLREADRAAPRPDPREVRGLALEEAVEQREVRRR